MFRFSVRRKGMLADTLVAAFVMAIVTSLVFGTILAGERLFNQATLRQGLQSDLSRLAMELKRDAELSDFWRCQAQNRSVTLPLGGPTVRRDGLALAGLEDWQLASSFDPATNLPLWDHYVVFYATQSNPGLLCRQEIHPVPLPSLPLGPYGALGVNLDDNPGANANVFQSVLISSAVQSFEVGTVLTNGSLTARIHLRREGGKRANGMERVVESLEATLTVRPKNTWPRV